MSLCGYPRGSWIIDLSASRFRVEEMSFRDRSTRFVHRPMVNSQAGSAASNGNKSCSTLYVSPIGMAMAGPGDFPSESTSVAQDEESSRKGSAQGGPDGGSCQ